MKTESGQLCLEQITEAQRESGPHEEVPGLENVM